MQNIRIDHIEGFRIGQAENVEAATGATVIIAPNGMAAGIDVRGGGPASRDTRILDPLAAAQSIHAVLLAGGSAFGLDAAGGVMQYLAEHNIGLPVGSVRVPLVCQSNIFDLGVGSADVYPNAAMAYQACIAAESGNYQDGSFGAGCGASVGKALGPNFCMKSGIGSCAIQLGELKIGAIMVVNALGDIFNPATGAQVAGLLSEDRTELRGTLDMLATNKQANQQTAQPEEHSNAEAESTAAGIVANTTIGAILTNAKLSKAQLCKVAGLAHDGLARTVKPVHTSMDGDSIYALSTGSTEAEVDLVGTLAAEVCSQAILCAVLSVKPAYGLPSAQSLA